MRYGSSPRASIRCASDDNAIILVTHYQRLLNFIVPDMVHVLAGGKIVKEGGKELALELEAKGLRLGQGRCSLKNVSGDNTKKQQYDRDQSSRFLLLCALLRFLAYRGSDVGQLPKLVGNLGGGPLFGDGGIVARRRESCRRFDLSVLVPGTRMSVCNFED